MKKTHFENGFTLVEILIVISIISTLFVIIIPQVNSYFTKTNEAGVRVDFRGFQQSSESYLRDSVGRNIQINGLNLFLDSEHKVSNNGSKNNTKSEDPWGKPYDVEFGEKRISFTSSGREDGSSIKKYELFSYYYNGIVESCTKGFNTGNIKLSKIMDFLEGFECGDELPDAPLAPPPPPPPPAPTTPSEPTNFKVVQQLSINNKKI